MKTKEFLVQTPTDFAPVIAHILARVPAPGLPAFCITLTGDLGAGKTTFTQQLAAHLGVTDHVVSPTFVVMKSYDLVDHPDYDQLVHIDAYRFEDESEAGPLRLSELFTQPRTLICLEWPDRVVEILPKDHVDVTITIDEGETRKVTVST